MDRDSFDSFRLQLLNAGQFDDLLSHYNEYTGQLGDKEAAGLWLKLARELEGLANTPSTDKSYASECLFTAGQVWYHKLNRRDMAMKAFQNAFKAHTSNVKALDAARDIYREQNNPQMVIRLYDLEARVTKDPVRLSQINSDIGHIHLEGEEADDAFTLFNKALELDPNNEDASDGLALVEELRRDWPRLVAKYRAEAEESDRYKAIALYLKAAEVLVREDPSNMELEEVANAITALDPRNNRVPQFLLEHYKATGNDEGVEELLKASLSTTRSKDERLQIIDELAQFRDSKGDTEGAARYLIMTLELDPGNQNALEYIKEVSTRSEQWDLLVEAYEKALRLRRKSSEELELLIDVGTIHWKMQGDFTNAEKYFRRIKLSDPRNSLMLDFYRDYYHELKDWNRLLSTLAGLQQSEEDPYAKIMLGQEMAEIAEEKLESKDKAADVWKTVLKIDPTHEEAKEELRRLYTETGKWNALLELYKDEIQSLDSDQIQEKCDLYREMIAIYRDHLRLDVMVINTWNAILALDPANTEALDALAEKFESGGRWNDLIGVLQKKVAIAHAPDEQTELLHQIADLWLTKFSNASQAIRPLEDILELNPEDAQAIDALEKIYRQRRDWRNLLHVLAKKVTIITTGESLPLYEEMATLASDRLGQPEEAIELWEARLDAGSMEGEPLALNGVEALDKLYTHAGQIHSLIELYRRVVGEDGQEESRRINALRRLGQLLASAPEREDETLDVWYQVLEAVPGDSEAFTALRDILTGRKDWDQLSDLFESGDDMAGYVNLLKEVIPGIQSDEEKMALLERVARIAIEVLRNDLEAVSAYEQIFAMDPNNVEVADFLAPVYERSANWPKFTTVMESLITNGDEMERPLRMKRLQQVWETNLRNPNEGFNWASRLYQEQPDEDSALELARLAETTDRWEELVHLYRESLEHNQVFSDPQLTVRTHLNIGQICMERLGWVEDAIESYKTAFDLDMECVEALEALERLYLASERWEDLVEVSNQKAELETDPVARTTILMQVGNIYENILDHIPSAVDAYQQVLHNDPYFTDALKGLTRLHERGENWYDLVSIIEQRISTTSDDTERTELTLKLGQVHEERLEAYDRAVELYGTTLEQAPGNPEAVARLENLFLNDQEKLAIARLLEPHYRKISDWESLTVVLEVLADNSIEPEFRVETFKEIAKIRENRLASKPAAFLAMQKAFAEQADNKDIWDELERLAGATDAWESLAALFATAFGEPTDLSTIEMGLNVMLGDEERVALGLRLARIREEYLDLPDQAVFTYEQCLEAMPDSMEALDALQRLNTKMEDWSALVYTLERRASLITEQDEHLGILFQMSDLLEELLDEPDRAVDVYGQVLNMVPDNMQALTALERLHGKAERWMDQAEILRHQTEAATDENERTEALYRLGQTLQLRLDSVDEGVEVYRQLLDKTPGHLATITALEDLLTHTPDMVFDPDNTRRVITEILEAPYQSLKEWSKLAWIYEIRQELTDSTQEKTELLGSIATLHEGNLDKGGDLAIAFDALSRALYLEPGSTEIRAELERLAGRIGDPGLLITAYSGAIDSLSIDPDSAIQLLKKAAKIAAEALGDGEMAIEFWYRLRDMAPEDRECLDALEVLLLSLERFDETVEILEAKIIIADTDESRISLLMQLGNLLQTELGDFDRAISAYRNILDTDPGSKDGLDALESLYLRLEQWDDLVYIYQARIDAATDDGAKREFYHTLALLWDERLSNPDEAISAYLTILDSDPTDYDAALALVRLYETDERWADLLDALERQVDLLSHDQDKAVVRQKQGLILRDHLFDSLGSIKYFTKALELTGTNEDAIEALESMKTDPDVRAQVAEVLEPVYINSASWARLASIIEVRLLDTMDPDERIELYWRLTDLHENKLRDKVSAFESLAKGLGEQHSNEDILKNLERLAGETGLWAELVSLLLEAALTEMDGEVLKTLYLSAARFEYRELKDIDSATIHFNQVLELDATSKEALNTLETIHTQTEDWAELLQIFMRKADVAETDQARIELYFKMADLQEEVLQDPDGAIEAYQFILNMDEANENGADRLESLLGREGRDYDLVALLSNRLQLAQDSTTLGEDEKNLRMNEFRYRLGMVHAERLGDVMAALEVFGEILEQNHRHTKTIEALEAISKGGNSVEEIAVLLEPVYRKTEKWDLLAGVLATMISASHDPEQRKALRLDLANIQENRLYDRQGAFDNLAVAYGEEPDDEALRDKLKALAEEMGTWAEFADILESSADLIMNGDTRKETLKVLSRICEDQLADFHRARDNYRRVLELDDRDGGTLTALERLYTRLEEWAELVELYFHKVDHFEEDGDKIQLYLRICNLLEEVLDDRERAISTYHTILDMDPVHKDAIKNLERILQADDRWDDLSDLLLRQMDYAEDDSARVTLQYRLGELTDKKLERREQAVDYYREALVLDQDFQPAITALENLLDELDVDDLDQSVLSLMIVGILEPIYQAQGEWLKLTGLFDVKLEQSQDPNEQTTLLREKAKLQAQKLGEPESAFLSLSRAQALDFSNLEVRGELLDLAEVLENWNQFAALYVDGLETVSDAMVASHILTILAWVFDEKMNNAHNAIACYKKLLEIDQTNMDAINALERLFTKIGDNLSLVEVLQLKAEFAMEVMERKEILYRICEIWDDHLVNPAEAIKAYRAVLEIDPEGLDAIEALERLYQETEDWFSLVEILGDKIELMDTDEGRIRILNQVAMVQDQYLADVDAALDAYRSILDIDQGNEEAMAFMQGLYQREERWHELLDSYRTALENAEDGAAQASIRTRMGDLLRIKLEEPESALDEYGEVLNLVPGHQEAMAGLEDLLSDANNRVGAARLLEPCYQNLEHWENLTIVLEIILEDTFDPESRLATQKRIAAIKEEALGDTDGALDSLSRAFREFPGDAELLENLDRLGQATDQLAGLAELVAEMALTASDPSTMRTLTRFNARLYNTRLVDSDQAIEWYVRLLEQDDLSQEALENLDLLYMGTENWEALSEILDRRITNGEGEQLLELRFRQGNLQENVFGDITRAIENYRAILWDDSTHEGAKMALLGLAQGHEDQRLVISEVLDTILTEGEEWDNLITLLEGKYQILDSPMDQAELAARIGTIHQEGREDSATAFTWYGAALENDPTALAPLEAMEGLVERLDGWEEYGVALEKAVEGNYDPEIVRNLTMKLANIYLNRLDRMGNAEALYLDLLENNPEDKGVLEALLTMYEAGENWAGMQHTLEQKAQVTYEVDERKALYNELATLAEDKLHESAKAQEAYQAILELDDRDLKAMDALERLYTAGGQTEELIDLLSRRIAYTEPGDLLQLHKRIGALKQEAGDENGAIDALRMVLDIDPDDGDALNGLDVLFEGSERYMDLYDILGHKLELAGDREDQTEVRVGLLKRLSVLASEHLDDYDGATGYLKQVVELAPEDREADELLEQMLARHRHYDELVDLLETRLDRVTEGIDQGDDSPETREERIQILLKLARISQEHLGDLDGARERLEMVLGTEPEHIDALGVLGQIHKSEGNWEAALEVMERQIGLAGQDETTSPIKLAGLLEQKADMELNQLHALEEGAETLRQVLELNPGAVKAADTLFQIRQDGEDWAGCLEILRLKINQLTGDDSRRGEVDLLKQMAAMASDKMEDPAAAVTFLEEAAAIRADDPEISRPLAEAYLAAGELDRAKPMLLNLVETLREARRFKELPVYHHQLGILAERMGDEEEAMAQYTAAHELDATYTPNLASLGKLHFHRQEWDRALKIFQTMLLHQSSLKTNEEKVEVYYHLGQVRFQMGDSRRARDMFNRALSIDPNHELSMEALEMLQD